MQIFFVDEDPYKAAQSLHDIHVRKQCVETAQILSTNLHLLLFDHPEILKEIYKPTHKNHPIVKWARESEDNMLWTLDHLDGLLKEYSYRTGKVHLTLSIYPFIQNAIRQVSKQKIKFNSEGITMLPDPNKEQDVYGKYSLTEIMIDNYRKYYKNEKMYFTRWGFAKWTKREVPMWVFE